MGHYRLVFSDEALADLTKIKKSGDVPSIKKVDRILSELREHPETGIGKPERLKFDFAGYWSR